MKRSKGGEGITIKGCQSHGLAGWAGTGRTLVNCPIWKFPCYRYWWLERGVERRAINNLSIFPPQSPGRRSGGEGHGRPPTERRTDKTKGASGAEKTIYDHHAQQPKQRKAPFLELLFPLLTYTHVLFNPLFCVLG